MTQKGTGFANTLLNEVCDQLSIKRLFSSPFHVQGNAKVENAHNFQLGIQVLFSKPFHSQGNAKVENIHNFLKRVVT